MYNDYNRWYAICSFCEWIAPLRDVDEDPTSQDVIDRDDWVASIINCQICDTPVILLLYREYDVDEDIWYSSRGHPTSGWGMVVCPTVNIHREIMDQILSENDIRYWLRNPIVA